MLSSMVPVDPLGGVTAGAKVNVTVPVIADGKVPLRVGVAASCCWKPEVAGTPSGVTVGAVGGGAALTVSVYWRVPVALFASVAVTVNVADPAVRRLRFRRCYRLPQELVSIRRARLPVVTANL